jgi:hypothetical protein
MRLEISCNVVLSLRIGDLYRQKRLRKKGPTPFVIPRSPRRPQNDKINYFFRSLKMLSDEILNDWGACPRRVGLAVMAKNVNCPLSRGDV